MLMHNFLENSRLNYPEKIAIKSRQSALTYNEMDKKSNQIAQFLIESGLKKGDRVVLQMDNAINTCISIYAVLKAGGVFVVVNPTTKGQKLQYIIDDCQAKAFFTQSHLIHSQSTTITNSQSVSFCVLDGDTKVIPPNTTLLSDIFANASIDTPNIRIVDSELASLIYTSGSTGNPKGVMMTHHNMVSALRSITTYLENVTEDIVINVLPLSFDYGLYQLLMTMSFSGTLILENGFVYPQELVQRMIEENVTGLPGVPTIFAMLFKMTDLTSLRLPSLRYISNTGAALPVEFIRKLRQFFPDTSIYSMYGLTECKRVAYLPPGEIDERPNSVGKAMPNCEVYIVDDDGIELGPDQIGELVIRGSNVMQGYWNLPEKTAERLRPGKYQYERVLYSGDLFYKDKDDYLYFVARKDDIIKSRGEKVSPKEIENVLYLLDDISEAAVIGVDDSVLGQAIKAIIIPRDGVNINKNEVMAHCKKHLENFAMPKYIEFRTELPHNSNGKIDKKKLTAMEANN